MKGILPVGRPEEVLKRELNTIQLDKKKAAHNHVAFQTVHVSLVHTQPAFLTNNSGGDDDDDVCSGNQTLNPKMETNDTGNVSMQC